MISESHKPDLGEGAEPQHWFKGCMVHFDQNGAPPLGLTTAGWASHSLTSLPQRSRGVCAHMYLQSCERVGSLVCACADTGTQAHRHAHRHKDACACVCTDVRYYTVERLALVWKLSFNLIPWSSKLHSKSGLLSGILPLLVTLRTPRYWDGALQLSALTGASVLRPQPRP